MAMDELKIERLYAERVSYLARWPNLKEVPPSLAAYQQKLQRKIAALDQSTIPVSMRLFRTMDPKLRYVLGSTLLAHYGSSVIPAIHDEFRETKDASLKLVLLRGAMAACKESNSYDVRYLLLLGEALLENRGGEPTPLPSGDGRICDQAFEELVSVFRDLPHEFREFPDDWEKRQLIFMNLSNWIKMNEKFVFLSDTGMFQLDGQSKLDGRPTVKDRMWPAAEAKTGWNLANKLDFRLKD